MSPLRLEPSTSETLVGSATAELICTVNVPTRVMRLEAAIEETGTRPSCPWKIRGHPL
jgi:hypothetical protein